jgi:transcriptional regulator with GAF, ATPase, and Fis domain
MDTSDEDRLVALQREVLDARKRLAATTQILGVIARSPSNAQPVFDTIAASARDLCSAVNANVYTYDGALLHVAALSTTTAEAAEGIRRAFPRPADPGTAAGRAIAARAVVQITDVLTDATYQLRSTALAAEFRSGLAVPLLHDGQPIGAIAVGRPQPGLFPEAQVALLQTFAEQAVIALRTVRLFEAVQERNKALARSLEELRRETESHGRSKATIAVLLEELRPDVDALVGASSALQRVREQMAQVAGTDSTVLIQGETGTGKELVARALHAMSRRKDRALVNLNCAALPRDLIESELFGHEKGAFTGATQQRRGRFELADGGTLFLDEIGELPMEAQAKLLRVLQDGSYERIGGSRAQGADVRVIAATNRDLRAEVEAGRFRSDLFYRLNVFPIALPPLRERREDIPSLVNHFVQRAARRLGHAGVVAASSFVERACEYDWPGNVRELANLIERALILGNGHTLVDAPGLFPSMPSGRPPAAPTTPGGQSIEAVERDHILAVLTQARWRIEGEGGAALLLGLKPSTLRARMRKLGLVRPAY